MDVEYQGQREDSYVIQVRRRERREEIGEVRGGG